MNQKGLLNTTLLDLNWWQLHSLNVSVEIFVFHGTETVLAAEL